MGFFEVLTIVFVILKATHNLDWSWWLVFSPELVAAGFYLVALIAVVTGWATVGKGFKRL
jgi:hypothetical protein